ncbi:MAG: hypothetical protein RR182_00540 [Alistipes sp.]
MMSTEGAVITLNGHLSLCQSVRANYTNKVIPNYEIGSPDLYLISGQTSGQVDISKMVSSSGFLQGFPEGKAACGEMTTVSINDNGTCGSAGKANIKFDQCLMQSIGIEMNVGNLAVSESVSLWVAFMGKP